MKKIFLSILLIAICVSNMHITNINAQENINSHEDEINELISGVEKIEGTDFDDKKVISTDVDEINGTVEIIVDNLNGSYTAYTTVSEQDKVFLMTNPTSKTRSIWTIVKTVIGIISTTIRAGKVVCQVIQYISGENVCGYIGQQLLNNLNINKKYKATSVLRKNPNCVPSHSAMCNSVPYVYWETIMVPV